MSLFWKLFAWFWLSQITVIFISIIWINFYFYSTANNANPIIVTGWSFLGWQLFILCGLGALLSYPLARYLASPAMKLRQVTRQLAAGDLKARIGAKQGRRRDEIADMAEDFDLMAERIELLVESERRLTESERRIVEAQKHLLADISHELRSPLARIAYSLDLARANANEETMSYLKRIERESGRLNELIGQLLTLARLEASQQTEKPLAVMPIDLSQLITDICQDAHFEATVHNRKVIILTKQKCVVNGNLQLLRSAIENVVRNAVQHTPPGYDVEVFLFTDGQRAQIKIRDYGCGVADELLLDLFRPFYRVAEARERESGGVGLGLSITDRAIKVHEGTVRAENAQGGGLQIEITLPVFNDLPTDEDIER